MSGQQEPPSAAALGAIAGAEARPTRRSSLRVGAAATANQFVFSGGNFLSAVLVGRYAGPTELGAYAFSLSIVFLIAAAHRALVIAPYTVQAQGLRGIRRRLRRGSALIHLLAALGSTTAVLAAIAVWLTTAGLASAPITWAAIGAIVGWCLREFCRRLLFADHRFAESVGFDGAVVCVQLTTLVALVRFDLLSAAAALAAVAAACGVVSLAWMLANAGAFAVRRGRVLADLAASWRFGRWAALSEGTFAGQEFGVQAILGASCDLASVGAYAACASIVRLATPVINAVGNALSPIMASDYAARGMSSLVAAVRNATRLVLGLMTVYFIALLLLADLLLSWTYGPDFAGSRGLLLTLAAGVAVVGVGLPAAKAISSLQITRLNFIANATGFVTTVSLAAALSPSLSAQGVAIALLIGAAVATACKWIAYLRVRATMCDPLEAPA